MTRYFIYILAFSYCLLAIESKAQELSGNSLYSFNKLSLNPAYAGYQESLEASLQVRSQGMAGDAGYQGALLGLNKRFSERLGIGTMLFSDTQGPFQSFSLGVAASYQLPVSEKTSLSFGMYTAYTANSFNNNTLNKYVNLNDPTISGNAQRESSVQIGAGLLLSNEVFELSLSAPSLFQESDFLKSPIQGYASYNLQAETISFRPSVMGRFYQSGVTQIDINAMLLWKDTFWLQPGYRSNGSILMGVGVNVNGLTAGYSFGIPSGDVKEIADQAHEVVLRIVFDTKHPRW